LQRQRRHSSAAANASAHHRIQSGADTNEMRSTEGTRSVACGLHTPVRPARGCISRPGQPTSNSACISLPSVGAARNCIPGVTLSSGAVSSEIIRPDPAEPPWGGPNPCFRETWASFCGSSPGNVSSAGSRSQHLHARQYENKEERRQMALGGGVGGKGRPGRRSQ
jgi:hypothetical protein